MWILCAFESPCWNTRTRRRLAALKFGSQVITDDDHKLLPAYSLQNLKPASTKGEYVLAMSVGDQIVNCSPKRMQQFFSSELNDAQTRDAFIAKNYGMASIVADKLRENIQLTDDERSWR